MNIDKFARLVADASRTKEELKQMFKNALGKELKEHAAVAKAELDRRFPSWDRVSARRGGAKETVGRFLGKQQHFKTSKEAYVWLVERFAQYNPRLFDEPSKDTLYVALGKRRNYFGRTLARMFRGTPHLAENSSNYVRLSNGWYANVNLNNAQKLDVLMRLAALARLEYGDEWDFDVLDASDALMDRQSAILAAKALSCELAHLASSGDSCG